MTAPRGTGYTASFVRVRIFLLAIAGVLMAVGLAVVSAETSTTELASDAASTTTVADGQELAEDAGDAVPPVPEPQAAPEVDDVPEADLDPEPQEPPAGGGAEAAEPPAEPQPRASPNLVGRLEGLLDTHARGRPGVAVMVTDAEGTRVVTRNEHSQLLPASTQKLVTAAAALVEFGPDHRYETVLRSTAQPDGDGVVHGDLVLVGSGDPSLGTPEYGSVVPQRPRAPLEALADRLAAHGVTRITGGIVGDTSIFPDEPLAPGWLPRYLANGHTTLSSGLTVNGGRRVWREGGRLRSEPASNPAVSTAVALHTLLRERDIAVDGSVASSSSPPEAPYRVASVASPPMIDLLRYTVQRSDNHMADAIFRTVGARHGDGTWTGSAAAVRSLLEPTGVDWANTVLADGSGLSRFDRLTVSQLTALDVAMSRSPLAGEWQSTYAVAGESGTLRRRLLGTPGAGSVRGKTGSLVDVRSLSGVVVGPGGDRYHFAIIGNGLDSAGKQAVRRLADEIPLALAEELHDCEHRPVEPAEEVLPDAEPATELVCAA
jgi:serine-type D-Ala-D-Ala carboxypeptidase/endopeptidase (penicillin-binding protein 4)